MYLIGCFSISDIMGVMLSLHSIIVTFSVVWIWPQDSYSYKMAVGVLGILSKMSGT